MVRVYGHVYIYICVEQSTVKINAESMVCCEMCGYSLLAHFESCGSRFEEMWIYFQDITPKIKDL